MIYREPQDGVRLSLNVGTGVAFHFIGDIVSTADDVCFTPCVDGSLLARDFVTLMQCGRVLPCVRPVDAARMAAGPNAIRGIGSQSKARARGTWGQSGFPGPRFDRLCITSLSLRQTHKFVVFSFYTAWVDVALR
jgi:hypothetical protein